MTEPTKALPKAPAKAPEPAQPAVGDRLKAAQERAPHLSPEFVARHNLTDEDLADIASGAVPPPPDNGPDYSGTDLHRTPGGWQVTHAGQSPDDVGASAISRSG